MSDILASVRRAVQMADTLHAADSEPVEQVLRAAERCREANREFLRVLEQLRPGTAAGEEARTELLQQLSDLDCGDKLLRNMLEPGAAPQAEIHTALPPGQIN